MMKLRIRMNATLALTGAMLFSMSAGMAVGDVVVLKNGKKLKGIVEEVKGDGSQVLFVGADIRQRIPRDRIESMQSEPEAQGHIHIAEEFLSRDNLQAALNAFNQALAADPDSQVAREKIEATRQAIAERQQSLRKDEIQRIEKSKDEVRELIEQKRFEEAETLLEEISAMQPRSDQKDELQALIGELYLEWAKDRLDKLDAAGAEKMLNLAYYAQPDNDEIVSLLLNLWEDQPGKREQTLRVYETVLSRRPEDTALKKKVADMHYDAGNLEEAAKHYLEIYRNSPDLKRSPFERRLVETLDLLHRRYASQKDFDKALTFFNYLKSIEPTADPTYGDYYRYMQKAVKVKGDDIPGRLELARFAEENGLFNFALQNYRRVLELEPENEAARKALDRYAMDLIEEAEESFKRKDYHLAQALALQVESEYPNAEEAMLRAREIMGRAANEIARDQRERRELAKDYIERGDSYYERALQFYRDIFNTEIQGSAPLSTPKRDAIRHFRYAVESYEAALEIDPSLRSDPASLVGPNLAEARAYLNRLTQGPPSRSQSFGRIIGPAGSSLTERRR